MQSQETSNASGLEDQLRSMILGNVTIGSGQTNHVNVQNQRGRGRGQGRGRGRGGYPASPRALQQGHQSSDASRQTSSTISSTQGMKDSANQRGNTSNRRAQHHGRPNVLQSHATGTIHNRPQSTVQAQSPRQIHGPRQQSQMPQRPPGVRSHAQGPYAYGQHALHSPPAHENPMLQTELLDQVAAEEVPKVEMSLEELQEKEAFRKQLENILQQALARDYSGDLQTVSLVGFGSLASGFGLPGSDMDLAIVPRWKDSSRTNSLGLDRAVPRLFEQAVLDAGMGGRLLTRTRVPILKVCQHPTKPLYDALKEERVKWNALPEEEKYPDPNQESQLNPTSPTENNRDTQQEEVEFSSNVQKTEHDTSNSNANGQVNEPRTPGLPATGIARDSNYTKSPQSAGGMKERRLPALKPWTREKILGPLDFPKTGVGNQVDINFSNPLGIHNTHLLRCYSLTDPRVRPMVLFVKSWAKRRKINSAYSGTLNSYGWVLMVLHYLVNIARPPVCPNLQHSVSLPTNVTALEQFFKETTVSGYTVRFWRNEHEISSAAHGGQLTQNRQTLGALLRGFFQYFASLPPHAFQPGPRTPQYHWTASVLSLRTPGGILTKQEKDWISAKTTVTVERKVTNRYLFAIEDPFETDHNVARTVTHNGIVAIRDEFRRAWRILRAVGVGEKPEEGLFDEVIEAMVTEGKKEENVGKEAVAKKTDVKEEEATTDTKAIGAQAT